MNPRGLHARLWVPLLIGAWSATQSSAAESVAGSRDSAAAEQLALEQRFASSLEPSRLRLRVEQDWQIVPLHNVVATLRGDT